MWVTILFYATLGLLKWYLVSPILIVLLNTNCKQRYSVTNTKCQPNILFVIPCNFLGGL